MICSRILNFDQNGVEFRQQINGAIRTSLTALNDDEQRRATSPRNFLQKFVTDTVTKRLIDFNNVNKLSLLRWNLCIVQLKG